MQLWRGSGLAALGLIGYRRGNQSLGCFFPKSVGCISAKLLGFGKEMRRFFASLRGRRWRRRVSFQVVIEEFRLGCVGGQPTPM
jgi:hypothetical protein